MAPWRYLNSRMFWKQWYLPFSTFINFPILFPPFSSYCVNILPYLIIYSIEWSHPGKLLQFPSTKYKKLHPSSPPFLLVPKEELPPPIKGSTLCAALYHPLRDLIWLLSLLSPDTLSSIIPIRYQIYSAPSMFKNVFRESYNILKLPTQYLDFI